MQAAPWLQASTNHFRLLTDGSPSDARRTLQRLEEIRQVLASQTPSDRSSTAAVPVFLLTSSAEIDRFRSRTAEKGFYVSGGFGDAILLLGAGTERTAFHEYVHLYHGRNALAFPVWLDEGLAELYSTLSVSGTSARVGTAIAERIAVLKAGGWIDLSSLLDTTKETREYSGPDPSLFYAESWALTHMLTLSEAFKPGLPRFLAEILGGNNAPAAFRKVYNKSVDEVASDLRAYLQRPTLPGLTITLTEAAARPAIDTRQISETEAGLFVADVLREFGRADEAKHLFEQLQEKYPGDPALLTGIGEQAMSEGRDQRAAAYFERAVQGGSRNPQTYYDYASLLRDDKGAQQRFNSLLTRAVELDPTYFNAQYLLGYTRLREMRFAEAQASLQRAAELAPSRAVVWEQLALASRGAGKQDDALRAARMALAVAASDADRDRMSALLRDVGGPAAQPSQPRQPDESAPKEARLRGLRSDASVTGELTQVDCLQPVARLIVTNGSNKTALLVTDPGAVFLQGAGAQTFQFSCGKLQPARAVKISYRSRADAKYITTGDVTAIEFQ